MAHRRTAFATLAAALGLSGAVLAVAPAQGADSSRATTVRNALSAAPDSVARHAAVYDWPAKEGQDMPLLRKGSNGWSCLPNDPTTPTNDPQCMNDAGMAWMDAWMAHRTPHLTSPGLSYVLQGCTVASNTDPYATKPADGHWIATGPHVMVFPTGKLDRKLYGTNPRSGLPYIRWAGTAYEHLVVPVPGK
jgi:hypothetical protein